MRFKVQVHKELLIKKGTKVFVYISAENGLLYDFKGIGVVEQNSLLVNYRKNTVFTKENIPKSKKFSIFHFTIFKIDNMMELP